MARQNELQSTIDKELESKQDLGTNKIDFNFQSSGVCIENSKDGAYVAAIVGGRTNHENEIKRGSLNRAIGSRKTATSGRQPGSVFKPVAVYAPAFDSDESYTPDKYIDNEKPKDLDDK